MTRRQSRTCLIAAVSVLALLLVAGRAQAMEWCSHLFPFGVINFAQFARVDVVLTDAVDGKMPCPMDLMLHVEVTFYKSDGTMIGDSQQFMLGKLEIMSADFKGDPGLRLGQRMENRATVMIMTANNTTNGAHDACLAEVRLSLQVVDRLTMRTQYAMTEVVMLDVPEKLVVAP